MPGNSEGNQGIFSSWYAVFFFILQVITVIILVPNSHLVEVYHNEGQKIYKEYGHETATNIFSTSYKWYDTIFEDTGINKHVSRIFIPPNYGEETEGMDAIGSNSFFPFMVERGKAITNFIYLVLERVAQITMWAPYLLIVLIPAAWDGFMTWKMKQHSFSYSSPWLHKFSLKSVYLFCIFCLMTLLLPFTIDPNLLPFIAMFLAPIVAISITAHLPKEI